MTGPKRTQSLVQSRQTLERALSEVERQAQEFEEITSEIDTLQLRIKALRAHNMHELAAIKTTVRVLRSKLAHLEDEANLRQPDQP